MTPAIVLRKLLLTLDGFPAVFHNHSPESPPSEFCWYFVSDSEAEETLDTEDFPDRIYFDLEIYAANLDRLDEIAGLLDEVRGFAGVVSGTTAHIQDVELTGQREDYTPQATGDSLPDYYQAWRLIFHGFEILA